MTKREKEYIKELAGKFRKFEEAENKDAAGTKDPEEKEYHNLESLKNGIISRAYEDLLQDLETLK